jgi:hypothetical protein
MAWMADRISDLEKSLPTSLNKSDPTMSFPTFATSLANKDSSSKRHGQSTTASPAGLDSSFKEEVLVQSGPRSRYFNEILLSRVIEEVLHLS